MTNIFFMQTTKKEAIDKIYEMFYTNDDVLKKDMTADRILVDKDVVEVII